MTTKERRWVFKGSARTFARSICEKFHKLRKNPETRDLRYRIFGFPTLDDLPMNGV